MKKTVLVVALGCLSLGLVGADVAVAQDEGPGQRYVTVTTFDVPFTDRAVVLPFFRKYFWAGTQLNPNIRNARMMYHNWGADASEIVIVSEFDSWEAIEADCGKPCDDYYGEGGAGHAPEEGEAGWEEYDKAQQTFSKYYATHRDEIYSVPMSQAKVDGTNLGPIGGPSSDDQ